jgi:ferredoxin
MKHSLTITGSDKIIKFSEDDNFLSILRDEKVYVKSSCGGHASCSDCLIKIVSGADNLNAASFEENQLLGNVFHITKERLACQTKATGPVEIDLTKHNKADDDEKIRQKSGNFKKKSPATKVRTKDDVKELYTQRAKDRDERKEGQDEWQSHWKKDKDPMSFKRLGGGKRPQTFRTDHLDEEEVVKVDKSKDSKTTDKK